MPGFDGTGPKGFGPLTGGSRGFCVLPSGNIGTGYRRRFAYPDYAPIYQAPYDQQEILQLKDDINLLLNELENLDTRISQMEKH